MRSLEVERGVRQIRGGGTFGRVRWVPPPLLVVLGGMRGDGGGVTVEGCSFATGVEGCGERSGYRVIAVCSDCRVHSLHSAVSAGRWFLGLPRGKTSAAVVWLVCRWVVAGQETRGGGGAVYPAGKREEWGAGSGYRVADTGRRRARRIRWWRARR